jgi:hypothetical protein
VGVKDERKMREGRTRSRLGRGGCRRPEEGQKQKRRRPSAHLAAGAAQGLVDHDARVGHRVALALAAGAQQERAHGGGQAEAVGLGKEVENGGREWLFSQSAAHGKTQSVHAGRSCSTLKAQPPPHLHVGAAQHHRVIDAHARGHGATWWCIGKARGVVGSEAVHQSTSGYSTACQHAKSRPASLPTERARPPTGRVDEELDVLGRVLLVQ